MPSTGPQQSTQGAGPQNGHEADQSGQYRHRQNLPEQRTAAEREYRDYAAERQDGTAGESSTPDLLLDLPVIKVDEVDAELDDLEARVSLEAELRGLLKLKLEVDAHPGRIKLNLKGVETQALLKLRLDDIKAVLERLLTTVDRNPGVIEGLIKGLGSAAQGLGQGIGQAAQQEGDGQGDHGSGTLLSEVRNGQGQTVRRTVDASGDVLETTLDEADEVLEENITGNLSSLPVEDERTNDQGQTVRLLKDSTGSIISQTLDAQGNTAGVGLVGQQ